MSSSLGSKTVRTADRVFLVALLIIYSVRFIVLMYALVCAVINFFYFYPGAEFNSGYGDTTSVKGRLKASSEFWASSLAASFGFCLSVMNEEYRLLFSQFPSRCFLRNNMSACKHPDFGLRS